MKLFLSKRQLILCNNYLSSQNPDIVLVHYLNYPYLEDDNHVVRDFCLNRHCNQWRDLSREEIYIQLLPMCTSSYNALPYMS